MDKKTIIDDCIKVFSVNKEIYIHNEDIISEMDKYYDNYEDKKTMILHEFIKFVNNRLNTDEKYMKRYMMYKRRELFDWFYSDEFKGQVKEIRELSNIEYYIYLTNRKMRERMGMMEQRMNYMMIVIIIMTILNVYCIQRKKRNEQI